MTTQPDPQAARLRDLGVTILETWDYDDVRAGTIERIQAMRVENPALYRRARATAFDMRHELGEHLPGIPSELVEQVTITVLSKVLSFAIGQGADPAPVLTAGSIAALAVIDDFWPPTTPAGPS